MLGAGGGRNLAPDALIIPSEQLPHASVSNIAASSCGRASGADRLTGLEPDYYRRALEEMEKWAEILAHEPEVMRKLKIFEEEARESAQEQSKASETKKPRTRSRSGPSL